MATLPASRGWATGTLPGLSREQAHRPGAREGLGGGRQSGRRSWGCGVGRRTGPQFSWQLQRPGVRTSRSFRSRAPCSAWSWEGKAGGVRQPGAESWGPQAQGCRGSGRPPDHLRPACPAQEWGPVAAPSPQGPPQPRQPGLQNGREPREGASPDPPHGCPRGQMAQMAQVALGVHSAPPWLWDPPGVPSPRCRPCSRPGKGGAGRAWAYKGRAHLHISQQPLRGKC